MMKLPGMPGRYGKDQCSQSEKTSVKDVLRMRFLVTMGFLESKKIHVKCFFIRRGSAVVHVPDSENEKINLAFQTINVKIEHE